MINIRNYDKLEPILYGGDFERVKLGYNECIIKNSYIQKTNSGRDALVLEIDINVGEQKDFFKKLYDSNTKENKVWGCRYMQLYDEPKQIQYFKGLMTSIEKSNYGFKFNGDEKSLIGKLIAGEFILEEYVSQDGLIKTRTKFERPRSIGEHKEVKEKVKLLTGKYVDYFDYEKNKSSNNVKKEEVIEIDPNNLPF